MDGDIEGEQGEGHKEIGRDGYRSKSLRQNEVKPARYASLSPSTLQNRIYRTHDSPAVELAASRIRETPLTGPAGFLPGAG